MRKSVAAFCAITSLAATATAQPSESVAPPAIALDILLEQRVAEELAADGMLLSRLGVALDVELVGDKLLVSLVDPATRRAVASTKLDAVPTDRDAAVAAVTQVAANLAAQLSTASTNSSTAALEVTLEKERRAREARAHAEYVFRQKEIRFGEHSDSEEDESVVAYQGDLGRRLVGRDLYVALGRRDLADAYSRRGTLAWVCLGSGSVAAVIGALMVVRGTGSHCSSNDEPQCNMDARRYLFGGVGVGVVGAIAFGLGLHYTARPHPISHREIYDLAAKHNAKLRKKHGLAVAPYASSTSGGVSIGGLF